MSSTETELTPDTNLDATADISADSQLDAASASSSSPEVDSAAAANAAPPANPEGDGNGSLKTGAETQPPVDPARSVFKQPNAQAQPPAEDWKKRHDGQFQANQRLSQELKQLKQQIEQTQQQTQQFAGYDPQKWQQFVQAQRTAGMPIWHPEHADHGRFQDVLRTAEWHERMVQRAQTPEQKEWALANYAADVGPEDQKLLKQFQQSGRQELQRLQMNPVGYLHQQVLPLLQQEMQKWQQNTVQSYQQAQQGRGEVEQWIQKNPKIATKDNLQKVHDLLGQGWPFQAAAAQVQSDFYQGLVSSAELKERSAEEKHRLLQANASVDRDQATQTSFNLYEETKKVAKQRGISNPFDPRYLKITDELRKKHNIKG